MSWAQKDCAGTVWTRGVYSTALHPPPPSLQTSPIWRQQKYTEGRNRWDIYPTAVISLSLALLLCWWCPLLSLSWQLWDMILCECEAQCGTSLSSLTEENCASQHLALLCRICWIVIFVTFFSTKTHTFLFLFWTQFDVLPCELRDNLIEQNKATVQLRIDSPSYIHMIAQPHYCPCSLLPVMNPKIAVPLETSNFL